ncbi:nuclear transport factor 2 family protein [Rhodobacteraceae bacterium LMO-12]|nr:nuclear transport factor 2 family protein [Rhodobacteraceae bacterium LMO-JJ12]
MKNEAAFVSAHETISRMFSLHDRREIDDQLACFTEDGVWRMSGSVVLNGRGEIAERLTKRSKTIVTAHIATNFIATDVKPDSVSLTFYLQIYAHEDGSEHTEAVPLTTTPYVNRLSAVVVRSDVGWQIREIATQAAVFVTSG